MPPSRSPVPFHLRLCVRPSVCPSNSGIVSKRTNSSNSCDFNETRIDMNWRFSGHLRFVFIIVMLFVADVFVYSYRTVLLAGCTVVITRCHSPHAYHEIAAEPIYADADTTETSTPGYESIRVLTEESPASSKPLLFGLDSVRCVHWDTSVACMYWRSQEFVSRGPENRRAYGYAMRRRRTVRYALHTPFHLV